MGALLALAGAAACASPASPAAPAAPAAPRGSVSVSVLPGARRATDAGIDRWIADAVRAVALLYPGFPADPVSVTVEPVRGGRGGDPVVFGRTTGRAPPRVRLHLRGDADDASLGRDWVAARLDGWLGRPLFTPITRDCLGAAGFPAVEPVLRSLGVSLGETGAVFDDRAPLAAVRRAITAPR